MRLAKTEALKKEIKFNLQNHEREVDAKVAIISMLERYVLQIPQKNWIGI